MDRIVTDSVVSPEAAVTPDVSDVECLCEAWEFMDRLITHNLPHRYRINDYGLSWLRRAQAHLTRRLDVHFGGVSRLSGEQQYQQAVTALAVRLKEAGLLLQDAAGFLRDKGHPKQAALAREKGRDAVAATEGLVD